MRRHAGWILAIAVAMVGPLVAQAPPVISRVIGDAQQAVRDGRYLAAIDLLEPQAITTEGRPRNGLAYQQWRQVKPFVTGELDTALVAEIPSAPDDATWARAITGAEPRDALGEIVRRAKLTSIVVLNESHYSPRDRAFALEVARALRPLGYSILATETFSNDRGGDGEPSSMERLRRDRFVRRGTGFYTLDPVYAGFVREAMVVGYEPVAYEQTAQQSATHQAVTERERDQADNLIAVLRDRPTAKTLVYVGYGHGFERTASPDQPPAMAGWLARISGVDPLTIDQTLVTDLTPETRLTYAAAVTKIGRRSAVFLAGGRPLVLGRKVNVVDLQVIHPPRAYRFGRPDWMRALGGRPLAIPADMLPAHGSRLVQAYAAGAPDDAVPIDQVLVTTGRSPPQLLVKGRVRLALQE